MVQCFTSDGFLQEHRGVHPYRAPFTDGVEALGSFRFHADAVGFDLEGLREIRPHSLDMRANLRTTGPYRGIHVYDLETMFFHKADGVPQKYETFGIFPTLFSVGEMRADVSKCQGA